MPRFEPFRALRYAAELPLEDVAAPPYDVLSEQDVDAWCSRHPRNVVWIDVPRERDGEARYDEAAARLRSWTDEGTLVRDVAPSFTLYRMEFVDASGASRRTVGVLGALEVVDEGAGGVLPHERTTPKAKSDRLDLTRATAANLSPVWGLSLTSGLTSVLEAPGEPLGAFVDEHGVRHVVERVDEPSRVAAISAAVERSAVLIADGHHRYAISRTFRDEVRAARGRDTDAELTLTYVAELVDEQLSIDAIHRIYRGTSAETLAERFATSFDLEDAGPVDETYPAQMRARGSLCLVDQQGIGTWMTPRAEAFEGVRNLDGALLEHAIDVSAAGASDDLDVFYQHGVSEVLDLLRSNEIDAAVLIRPTGIDEIRRTADERLLMPPKSTFFTPKLRTGLVIRPLTGVS